MSPRRNHDSATNWDPEDNTGGYSGFIIRLQEASTDSANCFEFIYQTARILSGTIYMTGVLGIMMVMTVLMIYFGITSLNDCPMKRGIPIYLLVGGCAGVLKVLILILKNRQIRKEDEDVDDEPTSDIETGNETYTSRSTQITEGLLNLFLVGWFAYGNYLIFSIYFPTEEAPMDFPQKWCNLRLYTFCLIHVFVIYALIAVFAAVVFCGTCCFRIGLAQRWV